MRYWEVQVDYYGKKSMSLLAIMETRWKVYGGASGLEYYFVDNVIKVYFGKYNAQVEAVTQLTVDAGQDRHPAAKKSSFSQIIQVVLPTRIIFVHFQY